MISALFQTGRTRRRPRLWPCIALAAVCFSPSNAVPESQSLHLGPFSRSQADGPFPEGWEPLYFDKIENHTSYRLIDDRGKIVVRADSQRSASGMIRRIRIDPRQYPRLQWRWKISNVYARGDVTRKTGDDYPARVYVAFAYDPDMAGIWERAKYETYNAIYGTYPPMAAITYIWASRAPQGIISASPYSEKSMMVVVRTGAADAGKWFSEERNIVDDYRRAFGSEPPDISGVAIMTDSDNTGEQATAWYGDILLLPPGNARP